MCINNHLKALQEKHAAADASIQLIMLCPKWDETELKKLKTLKCQLKAKILRLQNPARATAPKKKKPLETLSRKNQLSVQPIAETEQSAPPLEFTLGMKKVA